MGGLTSVPPFTFLVGAHVLGSCWWPVDLGEGEAGMSGYPPVWGGTTSVKRCMSVSGRAGGRGCPTQLGCAQVAPLRLALPCSCQGEEGGAARAWRGARVLPQRAWRRRLQGPGRGRSCAALGRGVRGGAGVAGAGLYWHRAGWLRGAPFTL